MHHSGTLVELLEVAGARKRIVEVGVSARTYDMRKRRPSTEGERVEALSGITAAPAA